MRIHGVNMSVGYEFEPEWFACGQSPLCVEVDRLVRSGVVVVVAAGNTGYGSTRTRSAARVPAGTGPDDQRSRQRRAGDHRRLHPPRHAARLRRVLLLVEGPDGRRPAQARPGRARREDHLVRRRRAAEAKAQETRRAHCEYVEDSGTSMAAPHVSGVIAAFLSIRREFIGRPENVKEIFCHSATDLSASATSRATAWST